MHTPIFYSPIEFQMKFKKENTTCVFGGSFDPIHEGHVCDLRELLEISHSVIFAPTAQNPWKPDQSSALSFRLEMIEKVLRNEDIQYSKDLKGTGLILSDIEYTFSIDLHKKIKEIRSSIFPNESIYWAIGDDLRNSAHNWKDWLQDGSDFIVLPTLEGYSSTAVRINDLKPHPAIQQYIKDNKLYLTR